MDYIKPQKIWALHPDHVDGPQWRRCEMSFELTTNNNLYVSFKVRRREDGDDVHELFNSMGFRASLDRLFEDFLREVFPAHFGEERENYIMKARTRGASTPNNGRSGSVSFTVSAKIFEMIDNMSNHEKLRIQPGIEKIAEREARRKSKSCIKG